MTDDIVNTDTNELIIKIDNRETIKNSFNNIDDTYKIFENLDLGDYLFLHNNLPVVIIERKTVSDWCASIKDGRYHEQKERLLANYSKSQILFLVEGCLITGNTSERFNKVSHDTLISSIMNTMFRDELHVIHTTNSSETIFFIESIFRKIKKNGINWCDSKTIKGGYSETLINELVPKKKDNLTPEIVYLSMLCCIPGFSMGIAKQIQILFPKWSELVEKIKTFLSEEEKREWIQNISIITSTGKTRKLGKIGLNLLEYI